ncbi:MAG: glycosyltransferase family 39 protein [Peptococcaceae bacterium]|nr:glycosyltransferase family 39 protein [Peptococcaceae bacterium]
MRNQKGTVMGNLLIKQGKGKKWRVDVFPLVLILIYLVLQMSAVLIYGDDYYMGDMAQMNSNDDVKYVRTALILLDEGELYYQDGDIDAGVPTVFIMPGFPIFLAAFLKIFGLPGGLLAVRLVQGLLQGGVMALLYRLGKKYVNVWAARVALILYLLYIPNLSVSLLILTEALFTFLFVLLVTLCFEAVESKRMRYYVGGAVVLGLAALIRPTILLFPVVILIMWLLKKYSIKEMLMRALVVGCILVALLMPWWIRNGVEFGRFIPLTVAAGDPFMQGAFIGYDMSDMGRYMEDFPPATDAFATDQAKMDIGKARLRESWQERPLATIAWYTVGKFFYLWGIPFHDCPNPYYESAIKVTLFRVPFEVNVVYHWLVLVSGIGGLVFLFRKGNPDRRLNMLMPLSMIYMCVVYLPYYVQPRYAYPIMPLVFLLAGYGIYSVGKRLRRKIMRRYKSKLCSTE